MGFLARGLVPTAVALDVSYQSLVEVAVPEEPLTRPMLLDPVEASV